MVSWFEHLSIRTRIILLMLVIAVPSAGAVGWLLASDLRHTRDAAHEDLQGLVTATSTSLQRTLADSEAMLTRLAARPLVRALDPKRCDPIVAEFVPLNPEYLTLDVRDLHGNLVCSHLPAPATPLSASESRWFQSALRSGVFKVSGVIVGARTGKKLAVLSYPVRDDAGSAIGLVILAVDLLRLNEQLLASTPKNVVVAVVDSTLSLVLRSAEPQRYIGTRLSPDARDPAGGAREGFGVATGRDGVLRPYAFATLPGLDWTVSAGVPGNEAFAPYDSAVTKTIAIGLGVLLFSGLLVWRLSAAIVVPIARLRQTAARVTAGDETARADVNGPPEIRSVAREFNQMLDARALSEARLQGIFLSAPDAILTADEQQVIVQANPAAAEMFRCPINTLIGMPLERLIPQRQRDQHHRDMLAFGEGADPVRHMGGSRVVTALRADGEVFPIDASVSHMSVSGQPLYTAIVRDVTERDEAQRGLRDGKAKLEAALSSMSDAVSITDTEGRLIEFNAAFAAFHRIKDKASCPRMQAEYPEILEVFLANGDPAPFEHWAVPRALRGETASDVEYGLQRKDTGEAWVGSYSFSPIRSQEGQIVGSVVTARDITALKQAQADLESSHAALQRLIAAQDRVQEDERGRIARELHDDLQQTLAAIRIDLAVLGDRLAAEMPHLNPLVVEADSLAAQAIASTRRIVSDLRPQMLEEFGLGASLEMLADQVKQYAGIRCEVDAEGVAAAALNDSPLLATSLFRVAQEALNNVVKHSQATQVTIRLVMLPTGRISLRVVDNGRGIRALDSRKLDSFGILGMRERVRAHGGSLSVERMPEGGTALEVIVPLAGLRPPIGEAADSMRSTAAAPGQDSMLDPPSPESGRSQSGDADALPRLLRRNASQSAQDVIDALDGNVAVLDPHGVIRLVNRAWNDFAERNGSAGAPLTGPGVNYLDVCQRGAQTDELASHIAQGLNAVVEGRLATFSCDYPCHSPDERRWFRMNATPMPSGEVLVTHFEIAGADMSGPGQAH